MRQRGGGAFRITGAQTGRFARPRTPRHRQVSRSSGVPTAGSDGAVAPLEGMVGYGLGGACRYRPDAGRRIGDVARARWSDDGVHAPRADRRSQLRAAVAVRGGGVSRGCRQGLQLRPEEDAGGHSSGAHDRRCPHASRCPTGARYGGTTRGG